MFIIFTTSIAPVAPIEWPRAIAPPFWFTFSKGMSSSLITAID